MIWGNHVKRFLLSSLMIAGLAACGQNTTPVAGTADSTAKASAEVLGFAAVTFTDVNTDHMSVSVKTSSVEDGLAGLTSQYLSRPAKVSVVQGTARGAFQDGSKRWMYTTLNVSNASTAAYSNVSLTAFNIPGYSLYDTSLRNATRQDGLIVTAAQAHGIIPVNTRVEDPSTGLAVISPLKADFQLYFEDYIQNITDLFNAPTKVAGCAGPYGYSTPAPGCTSTGNATAFPFGFLSRDKANLSTSRALPVGSNTGQMSVAFVANDSTPLNVNDDIRTFTFIGIITGDVVTSSTADKYETSLTRACAQSQAFGGVEVDGFDGQTGGTSCFELQVPDLRIAGDDSAPTANQTRISYP
jgi:hypothetical protein